MKIAEDKNNKINPNFFYRGNDIIKLWEQYLVLNKDNNNKNIKFLIEDNKILNSMFSGDTLNQQHSLAIILNQDNSLYKNHNKQSITLLEEVDHKDQIIKQHLCKAINQIKEYNALYPSNPITNHIIIFPYHAGPLHWNLGQVSITIKELDLSNLTIALYEPFGGKVTDAENKILTQIDNVANKSIVSIDNLRQQTDHSSCGVITAENGKCFLKKVDDEINKFEKIYEPGASFVREMHLKEMALSEIAKSGFLAQQSENENYEVIGDNLIENKDKVLKHFIQLINTEENLWIQNVLKNNLQQDRDDNSLRNNYDLLKQFIIQQSISDPKNIEIYSSILNKDQWQEGVLSHVLEYEFGI